MDWCMSGKQYVENKSNGRQREKYICLVEVLCCDKKTPPIFGFMNYIEYAAFGFN